MRISQRKSSLIVFLLVTAMTFSLMSIGLTLSAYAVERDEQTAEENYVEDIEIYTAASATETLRDYEFSQAQTEYNIVFPDSRAGTAPFVVTIPEEYTASSEVDAKLYCQFELDGKKLKLNNKSEIFPLWNKTTKLYQATALAATKIADGGSKLKIKVGKTDDQKQLISFNEYTYYIKKLPTLANSKGMQLITGTESVELVPKYSTQNTPYETNYTAVIGTSESTTLTLKATEAKKTEIYVNDTRLEKQANDTYTEIIEIPQEVKAKSVSIDLKGISGINNTYTLNLCRENYAPSITDQSVDMSTDKGNTENVLWVQVEDENPNQITYQWYKNKTKIEGATSAKYLPSQEFKGEETYYCAVTRTVNGAKFVTWSKPMKYTVNRNVPTAPTFSGKPYILGNAGSNIFVENDSPQIAIRVLEKNNNPIEDLPYQLMIYKNDMNSNEGGSLVDACTVTKTGLSSSSHSEYCFDLSSQEGTGTWYYYVKVEVTDGITTASRVSEPLKVTFKSVKDVVKKLEGSGSQADPFLLKDQNDLMYVKELVEGTNGALYNFSGQTLALENDIALDDSWEPIGCLKEGKTKEENGKNLLPFSGTIDGKGFTLKVSNKPLFSYVRRATIKNLNLFGEHINGYGLVDNYTVDYGETGIYVNDPIRLRVVDIENVTVKSGTKILKAGFIGGYASGVNAVNIRNCKIEVGVTIGDDGSWGALGDTSYGYGFISEGFDHRDNIGSFAGAFNGTITNSVSYATVYGRKNVGGLVGMKGQSMGSCDILNSSFQGKIIATGDKVGGIVGAGYISGSAPGTPTVEIHNCYVAADIQGNDKIGGLVGSEEGHEKFNDTGDSYGIKGANSISDNLFYGAIKAGENAKNIGGILGYVHDFSKKNGEATNFYLDSCGATNGIGGSVEETMTGVEKYASAASADEFKDGTVLEKLNGSSTSYQNWEMKQGGLYPTTTDKPVVTSLSIEGEWKSEYILGEALDLTGMKIYANWSDNTKTELEIGTDSSKENVVTYSGYNKNTRGLQTVTFQYKAIKATIGVTVLKPVTNPNEKITVRFTMYGDGIHDSDKEGATSHTLSAGNLTPWISSEAYQVGVNATVWDLLQEVQKKHSTELKFNNKGNYIDYLYYDSTKGSKFDETTYLGEFTNGKKSGWMYTLNGTHPLLGVEEQFLNNGDYIVWHYTDDYTKEEGSEHWNTPGTTEEVKNVTTDTKAGTTTSPTDVKVSEKTAADGTKEKVAEVTVSADNQKETIKQAKDNKSNEIILVVSKDSVKGASKADIKLDKSFIDSIVKDTDAKLTVKTPFGDKTYTQDELKALADAATGSTITITIEKAEEPADDAVKAEKIAKAKKLTASMKLTARTEKTAKKNIKVTIKTNSKTTASIKELKDLGYTVKYRYYRSAKKAAGYKSAVTKSTKSYINTAGTKGKMYYYKAQVRVYDENGKLITKTALKQCKYANRKWSK